jgi:hypothetical protein
MSTLQFKLILLVGSIPNNDIELRELLKKASLIAIHPLCNRRTWQPRAGPERRSKGVAGEATIRGNRCTDFGGRDNRDASRDNCRSALLARDLLCVTRGGG